MYIREVRQCGKNRVADIRHFFKAAKIPPVFRKNRKKILPHRWEVAACQKSLAEFAARRRQRNENHFLSRHVRERKYRSGCQCGICPSQTDKLCAQQTASLLSEKPGGFFDSLNPPTQVGGYGVS